MGTPSMNQTRLESLVEQCMSTLIGFAVSFAAWPVAAWLFDMSYTHGQHLGVTLFFTAISVARGYAIRRWFNARLRRAATLIARKVAP